MSLLSRPRIFLSYAREDLGQVHQLNDLLISSGISTWVDFQDLHPGDDWKFEVAEAIRGCDYFIAILSSRSISKRGYVQQEIREALAIFDQFPPGERFIIPARLDECKPKHKRLGDLHFADLFPSIRIGVSSIVKAVFGQPPLELPDDYDTDTLLNRLENVLECPMSKKEGVFADYPLLRVGLASQNCYAVHFDTGAPISFFDYDFLVENNAIEPAPFFVAGIMSNSSQRYRFVRAQIRLYLYDSRHHMILSRNLQVQAIRNWDMSPLARMCVDECEHNSSSQHLCISRRGLIGRNFMAEAQVEVTVNEGGVTSINSRP